LSDSIPSPALKRLAPGSGPLGCFVLLRGPYGPLAPPVPVGDRGRPPYFPILPWPWSSLALGAVCGADAEESEHGSPSARWVSGSGTHGSLCLAFRGPFEPLAPVVPVLGYHWRLLCFHGLSLILGFVFPLIFGTVLVHFGYGWRVWQVAPVFPLHGGLLVFSESSFSASYSRLLRIRILSCQTPG
jgi:hypothetical protein